MTIARPIALAALLTAAATAFAGAPTPVQSLPKATAAADIIVAVTVQSFTPDPDATVKPLGFSDAHGMHLATMINDHGTYHVKRITAIKGETAAEFDIHLPIYASDVFAFRTDPDQGLATPPGTPILLMLKKDASGTLTAVDQNMPLIPLSPQAFPAATPATQKAPDAVGLIFASLPDRRLSNALATLVVSLPDDRVAPAFRPFEDDKDERLRGFALDALARTQDLSIIPKIAKAAHDSKSGSGPVTALEYYKTAAAVPYLNPLIIDGPEYLRLNAIMALRPIADKTSIPYLMLALDTDDHQHLIPYDAYAALHRIIGDDDLPPTMNVPQFQQNKPQEIATLKQWWTWEKRKWNPATMPAAATPIPDQQR